MQTYQNARKTVIKCKKNNFLMKFSPQRYFGLDFEWCAMNSGNLGFDRPALIAPIYSLPTDLITVKCKVCLKKVFRADAVIQQNQ